MHFRILLACIENGSHWSDLQNHLAISSPNSKKRHSTLILYADLGRPRGVTRLNALLFITWCYHWNGASCQIFPCARTGLSYMWGGVGVGGVGGWLSYSGGHREGGGGGGGGGGFPTVVATFNHVSESYHFFMATPGDVWIMPSFLIWVMCCILSTFHVSSRIVSNISEYSFSSLNSSLGLTGEKHYQKIIPIFRLILQNFAFPGCFLYILFYRYLFSLFLQIGLLMGYVALFQAGI